MSKKETAIEVKVGFLVLTAAAILTAFVLVLGDVSFKPGVTVYVDFENAAGLKPGAPIRLAGIPAGTVQAVDYLGGEMDSELGRPVYVRATLRINEDRRDAIRQDARFSVTTQGILGEPYIEISSFDRTRPPIEPEGIYIGAEAPRIDMLVASAYDSLQGVREITERINRRGENIIRLDDFINNIADLAASIDERVVENKEEIDNIISNVDEIVAEIAGQKDAIPRIVDELEGTLAEYRRLGSSANRAIGDGSSVRNTLRNVESVSATAAREAEPLLVSARQTMDTANQILTENRSSVRTTIANAEEITDSLVGASADVREVIARIERGEGNVGRLLRDEEIFEDMREFVRELKRRPWRLLWKD
jgi:phospholipid/cholesterol/gamma-HCH transport system substrate-binding protein